MINVRGRFLPFVLYHLLERRSQGRCVVLALRMVALLTEHLRQSSSPHDGADLRLLGRRQCQETMRLTQNNSFV